MSLTTLGPPPSHESLGPEGDLGPAVASAADSSTAALPLSPAWGGPSRPLTQPRASISHRSHWKHLVSLTKPRLTLMVLVTVAVGFAAADRLRGDTPFRLLELTTAVLGTGLVAGAAGAWNMLLERDRDARMRRTAQRPLPSGALSPFEAGLFGTLLLVVGCSILGLFNNVLAAAMALLTFLLYVGVYTPLKARTTLNTAMGAIPGALPPAIGWAAATGQLGLEPLCLFLIVFLWQFPHFLAIAWLHRHDYAQAGYRMLTHPDLDPKGRITGRQALFHALALVPVGLLPSVVGLTGSWYFIGALALGTHYLAASAHFHHQPGDATARRLLKASFLYLPLLLSLLIYDRLPI